MTNASRKVRGRETEIATAAYYREHGWPFAEAVGSGTPGVDVTGLPGLACEVKARRSLDLLGFLRQAGTRPGLPYVVVRPDGYGPARIEEWAVVMTMKDHVELLRAAGYGTEL